MHGEEIQLSVNLVGESWVLAVVLQQTTRARALQQPLDMVLATDHVAPRSEVVEVVEVVAILESWME